MLRVPRLPRACGRLLSLLRVLLYSKPVARDILPSLFQHREITWPINEVPHTGLSGSATTMLVPTLGLTASTG